MKAYLKRLTEVVVVTFLAGAVPTWLQDPSFDRVALHGAIAAGVGAVYALVVKNIGDKERPTAL
jgi:hypothetical protein